MKNPSHPNRRYVHKENLERSNVYMDIITTINRTSRKRKKASNKYKSKSIINKRALVPVKKNIFCINENNKVLNMEYEVTHTNKTSRKLMKLTHEILLNKIETFKDFSKQFSKQFSLSKLQKDMNLEETIIKETEQKSAQYKTNEKNKLLEPISDKNRKKKADHSDLLFEEVNRKKIYLLNGNNWLITLNSS